MSDNTISFDEMLANMLEAMDKDNHWDTEAYAIMALEYLDSGKPISAGSPLLDWDPDSLRKMLESTRDVASRLGKEQKDENAVDAPMAMISPPVEYTEEEKANLIEQIVNFKG